MAKINSKETKYYTLRVTNKLVSEEAIWMMGELTRLHAKKRIQLDPKSYEGYRYPDNVNDIPTDDDPKSYEGYRYPDNVNDIPTDEDEEWESKEEIQSKTHDIYLADGGFTIPEAHVYRDKYFK
jgi:hypothetical protein